MLFSPFKLIDFRRKKKVSHQIANWWTMNDWIIYIPLAHDLSSYNFRFSSLPHTKLIKLFSFVHTFLLAEIGNFEKWKQFSRIVFWTEVVINWLIITSLIEIICKNEIVFMTSDLILLGNYSKSNLFWLVPLIEGTWKKLKEWKNSISEAFS